MKAPGTQVSWQIQMAHRTVDIALALRVDISLFHQQINSLTFAMKW
jgi:hypothetical protein